MKIAYVLHPDFTALDLVSPYEVISRWPEAEVRFLARSLKPVRGDRGLTVIPTDTPDTLPDPDLISSRQPEPRACAERQRAGRVAANGGARL